MAKNIGKKGNKAAVKEKMTKVKDAAKKIKVPKLPLDGIRIPAPGAKKEGGKNTEGAAAAEISFVTSESLDLTHFEQKEAVKQEGEKELSKVQTTTLYTIARKFLETAKSL